jgi:hypothetical protein
MKHLGWACSLVLALLTTGTTGACKRADPKDSQMSGEAAKPATEAPIEAPIAAPSEAPIAAPGERIPMLGENAGTAAQPAAAAKDTSFAVTLEQPADVAGGAEAVATVKVTPGAGYKMNHEYPTKLTLAATEGVTPAKSPLLKADAAKFSDHELAFAVKLTPAKAGAYTVNGTLSFAVCTDATCDPKTEKIAINVVAK